MMHTPLWLTLLYLSKSLHGAPIVIGQEQGNYVGQIEFSARRCNDFVWIALSFPHQGYAGISWLPKDRALYGAHQPGSDIWLYLGKDNLIDAHSTECDAGYGFCTRADEQQDVTLVCSGSQHFVAKRRISTGNADDVALDGKTMSFAWAATSQVVHSIEEANAEQFLHCAECASPLFPECTRTCPEQGRVGYMERDRRFTVAWSDVAGCETPETAFLADACL